MPALSHLGSLPVDEFLRDYWQKKPLLIRNAFPGMETLFSADELAGLALEEDVNSRLIIETPNNVDTTRPSSWQVKHGPLDESIFAQLPESHWSLLVQHVDSLDPRINAFLQNFRFIPNWRLDDIMISFATDSGGVGPHFDYYDVFLIQAAGRRRWRVGQHCTSESPLVAGQPMKILQEFTTSEDWIVTPGDLLYIPAQIAHWGEAIGESMTYSVGFRAPSDAEVLLDYAQEKASLLNEDQRYQDPNLKTPTSAGLIDQQTIKTLQNMLLRLCQDEAALAKWLGEYATGLKQDIEVMLDGISEQELMSVSLQLSPYCRAAYYCTQNDPSQYSTHPDSEMNDAMLFVNGESWPCSLSLAQKLSEYRAFRMNDLTEYEQKVVLTLAEQNAICTALID